MPICGECEPGYKSQLTGTVATVPRELILSLSSADRALFSMINVHWRRKWQPTRVFLPGESQGQGSLLGCRLWGRTESDTTEVT